MKIISVKKILACVLGAALFLAQPCFGAFAARTGFDHEEPASQNDVNSAAHISAYDEDNYNAPYGVYAPRVDENNVVTWDCLWFGRYYQDDTDKDGKADAGDDLLPIKWRVVSTEDNKALLLADKAIDAKPFNTVVDEFHTGISWDNSTIRSWLNGYGADKNNAGIDFGGDSFVRTAFSSAQKGAVLPFSYGGVTDLVTLFPEEYLTSKYEFGYDTVNYTESGEYYESDRTMIARNTLFALGKSEYSTSIPGDFSGNASYWVRSAGISSEQKYIRYDARDGSAFSGRADLLYSVRPAIYIDLSKESLYQKAGVVSSDGSVKEIAYQGKIQADSSDYIEVTGKTATMIKGDVAVINIPGVDREHVSISGPGTYDKSEGRVTGTGKGKIKVLAPTDSGGKMKTGVVATIKVDDPVLKTSSIVLNSGKIKKIKLSGTKLAAEYSSSSPEIAGVGSTGVISAFSPGAAVITASIGSHRYECRVKVKTSEGCELVYSGGYTPGSNGTLVQSSAAAGALNKTKVTGKDGALEALNKTKVTGKDGALEAYIDGDIDTGKWGGISYSYDTDTEVLTISGKGKLSGDSGVNDYEYRTAVSRVEIKSGVTGIGDGVFDAWGMTRVSIPNSVTEVGTGAFKDCYNLEKVVLPDSIEGEDLGADAFNGCASLVAFTLPLKITRIKTGTLANMPALKTIEFPYAVTDLDTGSCSGSGFNEIVWSRNMEHIGPRAFADCSDLTEVTFPSRLKSIDARAFSGCSSLKVIKLPKDQLGEIGEAAFENCSLTDVYYAGSQADWEKIVIRDDNEDLINATIHFNAEFTARTTDHRSGTPKEDSSSSSSKSGSSSARPASSSVKPSSSSGKATLDLRVTDVKGMADTVSLTDNGSKTAMLEVGSLTGDHLITIARGSFLQLQGGLGFSSDNRYMVPVDDGGLIKGSHDTSDAGAVRVNFFTLAGGDVSLYVRVVNPGVCGISGDSAVSATQKAAALGLNGDNGFDLRLLCPGAEISPSSVTSGGAIDLMSLETCRGADGFWHIKGKTLTKGKAALNFNSMGKNYKVSINVK